MNAPINPLVAFKHEARNILPELALPPSIAPERMFSALTVAVQRDPKLLMADRASLWQSARACAADGLLPDGREAAFVLFRIKKDGNYVDAVQYIPMVAGLRKRAKNSGEVADIRAYLVYEGEWNAGRFEMVAGDEEAIIHRPIIAGAPGEPERGALIGGYAIAVLKDGQKIREWMPVEGMEKRRRASYSQRIYEKGKPPVVADKPQGVWADWYEEQCLKTLVRAISKKLPLSSEDYRAIVESDEPKEAEATPAYQPTMEERLRAAAEAQEAAKEQEREFTREIEDADVVGEERGEE